MRGVIFILSLFIILTSACSPSPSVSAITPPYVDTSINPDSWATIPAGEFPYGQHDHITLVDYDYDI